MKGLSILFMGSPAVAVIVLRGLIEAGFTVSAVVTQPDKPAGRGQKLTPPPVKEFAMNAGVPVLQPLSLKDPQAYEQLKAFHPQVIVVAAYGKILPQSILDLPAKGCINVHFSLLPRYRGASCVASAIRNGDTQTGVTIMQVVQALDAGPIYRQLSVPIAADDTTGGLEEKLAHQSIPLLIEVLQSFVGQPIQPVLQDETQMTYAPLLRKEEAQIDWRQSAVQIDCLVRAMNPWPVAYTFFKGQRLKIFSVKVFELESVNTNAGVILEFSKEGLRVACGRGSLFIQVLQPENKKKMPAQEFYSGYAQSLHTGEHFS